EHDWLFDIRDAMSFARAVGRGRRAPDPRRPSILRRLRPFASRGAAVEVAEHAGRSFLGFNRAAHAVVEGCILVTRLHLLGVAEVMRRLADLEPLVEKTGGPREREAYELVVARARRG
ncbi:MAG: hypothetical protein ACKON7_02655, partial [Planctomycetaceae bacterium]